MLLTNEKPIRITNGYVQRNIHNSKSVKNLEKLSLRRKYIESKVETLEFFRDRKMELAIKALIDEGQEVTIGIGVNKL